MKLLSILFCMLFVSHAFAFLENVKEYHYLDNLALSTQADKSSNYHNYTEIYARYFASLKDKPIKFLEIGIDRSFSVRLWEKYFKQAELHFIDITVERAQYFSERSHYHLVDQENPQELQDFIQKTGGGFDIIIDDGGHTMNQQIVSFQHLFPHVKSGGLYIIEDLHTSYWEFFGGGDHSHTTISFLKGLIDEVNAVGARSSRANHRKIDPDLTSQLNTYQLQIESIHFYDSVAVIIKR